MNPKKKKKLILTVSLVGTFLLVIIIGIAFLNKKAHKNHTKEENSSTISTKETSSSSVYEITVDEKNYQEARSTLERPSSVVLEEKRLKVIEALKIAVQAIKDSPNKLVIKSSLDNHLSSTENAMVQTFASAFNINGYSFSEEKTEIMQSNSTDVLQYICVLTKDGEENSYFVGNYNIYTGQLQITSYHGGRIGGVFD